MTVTETTDHRRWVEVLAYRAMSFPTMSFQQELAEIAPGLPEATRDSHFADLVDGLALRDAACKMCETEHLSDIAAVLAERVDAKVAVRAAGVVFAFVASSAKTVAACTARDFEALAGRDLNLDGALAELAAIKDGDLSAYSGDDCPSLERIEELAEQKVTAALADYAYRMEVQLKRRLEQFTVAAWRFADGARLRLTGGAR